MPRFENRFLDPSVHLFSKCPNCEKLIPIKTKGEEFYTEDKNCQNCGFEFNSYELLQNLAINTIVTQAVSSANSITGFDLAVVIFIPLIIFLLFIFPLFAPVFVFIKIAFLFNISVNFLPVIICIRWLLKFGRWQFEDEEFTESKKKVKSTLFLWVVAHIFSMILYLYKFWS